MSEFRSAGADVTGSGQRGVDYPWFNPADFVAIPGCVSATNCPPDQYGFLPYARGNAGRNILDGPGLFNVNTTLFKSFYLSERRRFQVQWEVFNIFNTLNFLLPDRNFNDSAAGIVSGEQDTDKGGGPRTMQLAMKYIF